MRTVTKDQLIKIVAAAMLARDQAVKLAPKNGRVPASKFPGTTLSNFQKLDGSLTVDNYYGPNVVAALKWYLQKSKNPKVPLAATKYDHIKVTWVAPSLYEPSKPATTAAIPTPKPAPKPAPKPVAKKPVLKPVAKPVIKKPAPKPVLVATSKAAPSPAPAPAPAPAIKTGISNYDFLNVPAPVVAKSKPKVKPKPKPKVKVPATPAHGQELHTIKPKNDAEDHIAAKATGNKAPKAKSHDAEDLIAEKVAKASAGAIQKINQKMIKDALQKQATSEHKNLNKEAAFKKDVLNKLKVINERLKAGKPAAQTTAGERRIVGLVL